MTPPETQSAPTPDLRLAYARIIDPLCFRSWQALYDYGIGQGDSEEEARKTADWAHKKACDEALAKADQLLALKATHLIGLSDWSFLPKEIGRLKLGERPADNERYCHDGHVVPDGAPLYWPRDMGANDDSDPRCLEHAIDLAESDSSWCQTCISRDLAADEAEKCTTCGAAMPHGHMACDETMGQYCETCWPAVDCENKHGEGCATAVWESPADNDPRTAHRPTNAEIVDDAIVGLRSDLIGLSQGEGEARKLTMPNGEIIEVVGDTIQRAWNADVRDADGLPPIDLIGSERDYLANAVLSSLRAHLKDIQE